jgi:hypothetical protein
VLDPAEGTEGRVDYGAAGHALCIGDEADAAGVAFTTQVV